MVSLRRAIPYGPALHDIGKGGQVKVRSILQLAMMVAFTCTAPALAAPTGHVTLPVSAQRSATLVTWVPKEVKGVVLFSTGHGSWPERYEAAVSAWQAAGFAVIAPLHVDSMHHPDREKFDRAASFGERIADLKAASAYAARAWPGKPVIAAGHSFGTLAALCLGGGLTHIGNFRDPAVKGVLGFSSPGRIPGLVAPQAYATDALPMLIVTGDQDLVPGLVADWHDHLFPVQSSPAGDKFAVAYDGAAHDLIGRPDDPNFASAIAASIRFLRAYALDDTATKKALADEKDTATAHWTRR